MSNFCRSLRTLTFCTLGAFVCAALEATEVEVPPGAALYEAHCAACHTGDGKESGPHLSALRRMSPGQIQFALSQGKMREQAKVVPRELMPVLLSYLSPTADGGGYQPPESALCREGAIATDPQIAGFGFNPHNTRYQPDTTITAANIEGLKLAWAFGLPETTDARSQPVITSDTVFIAAVGGSVFALDRHTGCTKWQYRSGTLLRTPLTLGRSEGRAALFVGDFASHLHALEATTGELLWKSKVGLFDASTLTGGSVQHEDTLYVPVSAFGVALAQNPEYECCRSHGALQAVNANTGEVRWTAHMTPPAQPTYVNDAGTQMWGPSGAPVWATPAVDAKRKRIYIGTGENTSTPATELSDAILALDMATGAVIWSFQGTANDAFNMACGRRKGPSCPKEDGPDFDFGAAPVFTTLPDGSDVIIAGQKSGMVHALDAETGRLLWQTRVGQGSALGGVHWGLAVSGDRVVVPINDPGDPRPGYDPKPGLYALDVRSGRVLWSHRAQRGCDIAPMQWYQREQPWPECAYVFGFSAAATATVDLAFAASLNGMAYAFALDDGRLLWQFQTKRAYDTVNGLEAHGGSIDNAGIQITGDMLFVQSGYSMFGQMPGNVLLAFRLPESI